MTVKPSHTGIDRFRIIAALLVVAVHTSPLLSMGAFADHLFTRVVARLGVPFFFSATGFFLLDSAGKKPLGAAGAIGRFVKKTWLIYGAAIALYLPINVYAGHMQKIGSMGQAVKLLLVDGTMYHLWYLPAAAFGVVVAWGLRRTVGLKAATAVAAALYGVGLLGDSYYGLVRQTKWLWGVYEVIFKYCDYTRNGLFYAPIFLLVGQWAAKKQHIPRGKAAAGLGATFALLLVEGVVLYLYGSARHDSMYLLLPLCVFFLMAWLATFKGEGNHTVRGITLVVYIIHPWVIVLLRGFAKLCKWERWLVANSVVHYIAVCLLSFLLALVTTKLANTLWPKPKKPQRAWIEIDLAALGHNVRVLQGLLAPGCALMPAIKANAYGFGAVRIAKELHRLGVKHYCVASLSEGIALRRHGVRGQILILGYTKPEDIRRVKRYRLSQTIVDYAHGIEVARQGFAIPVHIKVDTGMNRLGARAEEIHHIKELLGLKQLDVRGIFTQLSCSDSTSAPDIRCTRAQIKQFDNVLAQLKASGARLPKSHVQCSYGIINYVNVRYDYARPGLALYGIVEENRCMHKPPDLVPIFQVKTQVALTKAVRKGERIGYGDGCIAAKDMTAAVITMGYADGLPRCLSGGVGQVLVHGKLAPIVGNICMDQAIIDVTDMMATISAGDTVTMIGEDKNNHITIAEFSAWAQTIPNEIISRFGRRVELRYVNSK